MEILSRDFENQLKNEVLAMVSEFLAEKGKAKPRLFGIVSKKELKEELGIRDKTIQKWEEHGLKRYIPPIEATRTIFYRVDDVLMFLGIKQK